MEVAYWKFALDYYRKNGAPTGEVDNIRAALRPLRKLFGCSLGSNFGPDALELIREEMIRAGLSRKVINARVSRIKRMFRWASRKRLVPPATYAGLMAVDGLRRGRSAARETTPVIGRPSAARAHSAEAAHNELQEPAEVPHLRRLGPEAVRPDPRDQVPLRLGRTRMADIAEDFRQRGEKMWNGKPWTQTYGARKRINLSRYYRAYWFVTELHAEGQDVMGVPATPEDQERAERHLKTKQRRRPGKGK